MALQHSDLVTALIKDVETQRARVDFLNFVIRNLETLQQAPQTNGWVYATSSTAAPGYVIIGKTHCLQDLFFNIASVNTLVALARTQDPSRDHAMAHGFFAPEKFAGEIFNVGLEQVKAFFHTHIDAQYLADTAPP